MQVGYVGCIARTGYCYWTAALLLFLHHEAQLIHGGLAWMTVADSVSFMFQCPNLLLVNDNDNDTGRMIKFVGTLPLESIVDVQGQLVEANVKSCTQV